VLRANNLYIGFVWMSDCCDNCVLSGISLGDGMITCSDESYGSLSVLNVECCQVEDWATADHLYRLVARIFVFCECCVLSCRGLCDRLIPCTEESYGYLFVVIGVCCQVEVCSTC